MSELETAHLAQSASLRDRALKVIRQAIVSGRVRPGKIYSAASFASQLGVSTGPVREAMLTLVNEGILEPVRNRGFRVVHLTDHDLDEVYQLRLMLEVPAVAALAQVDLSPHLDDLHEKVAAIEDAAQAGDVEAFLEHDRNFHLTILRIGGNQRLVDIVALLRDQTRLYGLETLAEHGLLDESASEHRAILDALAKGQAEAIRELMTRHLGHINAEWSATQ